MSLINGEEYILDIKVEEKTMEIPTNNNCILSPVYEIEDIGSSCSTITAPETILPNKNVRVLIKKLPQKVLDKYFPKKNKEITQKMSPPRTSKRLSKYYPKHHIPRNNVKPFRISQRVKYVPANYKYLYMTKILKKPPKIKVKKPIKSSHNLADTPIMKSENQHENKSMEISKDSTTISKPTQVDKSPLSINIISKPAIIDNSPLSINLISKPTQVDKSPLSINLISKPAIIDNSPLSINRIETNKSVNATQTENHTNCDVSTLRMESSKILVIKQPILQNDPLNISSLEDKLKNNDFKRKNCKQIERQTTITNEEGPGDSNDSEIVERIYFTNKSVQTKFTCNGSICGLVDSDEFNLNCFYCYKKFPLYNWFKFKEHLQRKHNVKEKSQHQKQQPEPYVPTTVGSTHRSDSDFRPRTVNPATTVNNVSLLQKQQQPQQMIINEDDDDGLQPPLVNKTILRSLDINGRKVKLCHNKSSTVSAYRSNSGIRFASDEHRPRTGNIIMLPQQQQPIQTIIRVVPPINKAILIKNQDINAIKTKFTQDLNRRVALTNTTGDLNNKVKSTEDLNKKIASTSIGVNNNNKEILKVKSTEDLNRKIVSTNIGVNNNNKEVLKVKSTEDLNKKINLNGSKINHTKNPACYIDLTSSTKVPNTTQNKVNQSKELFTKPLAKNNLNQSKDIIDLTSVNRIHESSSSIDDLNKSSMDDIISIGDDEEEDDEFDEIFENFSKDVLTKNAGNNNVNNLNISPTKTTEAPKLQTLQNSTNNLSAPTSVSIQQILPSLPQLTIKKLDVANPPTSSFATPQIPSYKKAYIKLPTNLNIEEVLKTIPKPRITSQTYTSLKQTKPRYFVVKKVIKPTAENLTKFLNLPTKTVLSNITSLKDNDDDDDMPSNDENEDIVPKPTNGCGILFGLTHREVVLQFLMKLQTYPELWRPQVKQDASVNYDQSIKELCKHLNDKFDLNIEDFEMRLSIQRVKDWYCRMLKNIFLHNQNRNNIEPYKHTFPEYFKILNKFLTSDVHYTKNLLLSKSNSSSNDSMKHYPKWMYYKTGKTMPKAIEDDNEKEPKKPIIKFKDTTLPDDDSSQNVIEFDADTLYGDESTDEENVKPPKKVDAKARLHAFLFENYPTPRRTKVYRPLVPIVCDICSRDFKRYIDLRRHRVGHFPPKFQCSVCSQMYMYKHWAEKCKHVKQPPKKKYLKRLTEDGLVKVEPKNKTKYIRAPSVTKWICEMCGASYRSVGSLNAHKRDKHLNQRLKCVVCKFTAVTNYRIVQHQKKRHVVEPGTVEEVAKKCRARLDSKTPFTPEARQEFDWRREQRKKLKPGELFYGCCKCRIIFETRKEKVLHNKLEHPIKDTTVICLLCHPEKMLLSNSNSVRRHYTDIHKVPWDEIDDLVKRTKPIFQLLNKDEIDILNSSVNYTELLTELLATKKLKLEPEAAPVPQPIKVEEATQAVEILAQLTQQSNYINVIEGVEKEEASNSQQHVDVIMEAEENVFVDGIIDHDYNNVDDDNYTNEHNYTENLNYSNYQDDDETNQNNEAVDNDDQNNIIVHNEDESTTLHTQYQIMHQSNDQQMEINDGENGNSYSIQYGGDELIEESIVVEEFVDDDLIEEDTIEDYF